MTTSARAEAVFGPYALENERKSHEKTLDCYVNPLSAFGRLSGGGHPGSNPGGHRFPRGISGRAFGSAHPGAPRRTRCHRAGIRSSAGSGGSSHPGAVKSPVGATIGRPPTTAGDDVASQVEPPPYKKISNPIAYGRRKPLPYREIFKSLVGATIGRPQKQGGVSENRYTASLFYSSVFSSTVLFPSASDASLAI